jgi:hypothetical protein
VLSSRCKAGEEGNVKAIRQTNSSSFAHDQADHGLVGAFFHPKPYCGG